MTHDEIVSFTKGFFNLHPDTDKSERFSISLFQLINFAIVLLKKAPK